VTTDAMFSVRAEVLPFEPKFETSGRRWEAQRKWVTLRVGRALKLADRT